MDGGVVKELPRVEVKKSPDFIKSSPLKTDVYLTPHESGDEYLSKNWRGLGNLLGKIQENPEILAKMPPLPLPEDSAEVLEGELRQRRNMEFVGVDLAINDESVADWMESNGIDQELLDFKFDISSRRFSKINKDIVGTPFGSPVDTPNPIADAITEYSYTTGDSEMSVRKLLETMRPLAVGQEYVDKHSQVAIEEIKRVSPDLLPKDPIEFVYMPDLGGKGMYLGEVGGKHYIACNPRFDLNPYMGSDVDLSQYPDQHDITSEVHEILHAKTGFDNMDPPIVSSSPYETAKNLLKAIGDENNNVAQDPTMAITILEGLAYTGQISVLNSQIESCHDPVQKNVLEKVKDVLWNELKYINESGQPFDAEEVDLFKRYRDGVEYINKIKNVFGEEKVFDVLMNIDYKALSSHEADSPEIMEIRRDPKKLPMKAVV